MKERSLRHTTQLTAAEIAALGSALSITQTDNANTGKVTWTYKITDSTLDFLGANEAITVTTLVVIDDHHGHVVTENVVVTVNGADDKPKVSAPIISTASEDDAPYTIDLLQFASDPDTHDILHVGNVTGLATGVSLVGDALHVDPNAYNALSVGQHATLDVRYSVVDGTGNSVQARATITINGANDAPTAVPDTATVQTGSKVTGNVLTNDTDPDAHDTLHVNAVSFGNANSIVTSGHPATIDGDYGTLTLGANGVYSYVETSTHAPNDGAVDIFTYTIDDGHGGSANSTVTINVTPGPNLSEYYNAAEAVYQDNAIGTVSGAHPPASTGLTLLLDSRDPSLKGNASWLSDGMFAQAFQDKYSDVIISFEGSILKPNDPSFSTPYGAGSRNADLNLLVDLTPKAFVDAEDFALDVKQFVQKNLGANDTIYVTGHSLGGAEAQDVAFIVGLQNGVTFGAPGDPTLPSPVNASNFTNFVETEIQLGTSATTLVRFSMLALP